MPSGVKLFLFILALPLIAAVSHDVYLNYFSSPEKIAEVKRMRIDADGFEMTALGWVWIEYSSGTYEMMRSNVSEETWKTTIVPLLKMKTIIVSVVPITTGVLITLLLWLFGLGPFKHLNRFKSFKSPEQATVYNKKAKKAKYGRK